ncbi:MAG: aminoglycoside phosphotransferase family protein [Chloroflexi bacterium]|nr:aminoglycoside phosphotransferase family protein [Chloroflexota bacterium]
MSDSSPNSQANARLVNFVHSSLGTAVKITDNTRGIGRRSLIWRVEQGQNHFLLKAHDSDGQFERETRALREWVPILGDQSWWSTPDILAKNDELQAIVISEVRGGLLDSTVVSRDECQTMFELAGRFARLLHDSPIAIAESVEPVEDVLSAAGRYIPAAVGHLDSRTIDWAKEVIGDGQAFANARVVPAHMDYSPRNWFADRQGRGIRFGLIDWEQSRHSIWLQDVARMAFDHWQREPVLRDYFFRGYGRQPTEIEERQMQLLALINMIGGVPYSVTMGDKYFENLCRGIIELLKTKIR